MVARSPSEASQRVPSRRPRAGGAVPDQRGRDALQRIPGAWVSRVRGRCPKVLHPVKWTAERQERHRTSCGGKSSQRFRPATFALQEQDRRTSCVCGGAHRAPPCHQTPAQIVGSATLAAQLSRQRALRRALIDVSTAHRVQGGFRPCRAEIHEPAERTTRSRRLHSQPDDRAGCCVIATASRESHLSRAHVRPPALWRERRHVR